MVGSPCAAARRGAGGSAFHAAGAVQRRRRPSGQLKRHRRLALPRAVYRPDGGGAAFRAAGGGAAVSRALLAAGGQAASADRRACDSADGYQPQVVSVRRADAPVHPADGRGGALGDERHAAQPLRPGGDGAVSSDARADLRHVYAQARVHGRVPADGRAGGACGGSPGLGAARRSAAAALPDSAAGLSDGGQRPADRRAQRAAAHRRADAAG